MSAHDHAPAPGHRNASNGSLTALAVTFALTATIFLAQVIGGLFSGSLALLSDAMHMLSDSTGLLIALVALLIGRRAATPRATYGYRRVEVLAALVNAGGLRGLGLDRHPRGWPDRRPRIDRHGHDARRGGGRFAR